MWQELKLIESIQNVQFHQKYQLKWLKKTTTEFFKRMTALFLQMCKVTVSENGNI